MAALILRSRSLRLLALATSLALGLVLLVAPGSAQADEPEVRDLDAACPATRVPDSDFTDIGPPFDRAIECLVWYDVTRGRTAETYDTGSRVTRGQMALFLYRLLSYNLGADALPGEGDAHGFADVPTSGELGRALNALSSDELAEALDLDDPLVRGFGDGTYRAGAGVERAQMASFIARTFGGLLAVYQGQVIEAGMCTFTDSGTIPEAHRTNVSDVCAAGIAQGRTDGSFAPRDTVTRGQMAAFLMRTQDIFADEPFHALLPDQDLEIVDRDRCDAQDADGSADAPWCTIQDGVDAAATTTRVLVHHSEDFYEEDVDIAGGLELMGLPAPSADGDFIEPPLVEGSINVDAEGQDLLLGRLALIGPDEGDGLVVVDGATARLTGLTVTRGEVGIEVQAEEVFIDASGVGFSRVGIVIDADRGDVRDTSFLDIEAIVGDGPALDAFLVDERGTLDLSEILERDEPGVANRFEPAAMLGEFEGSPAIVPEG